MMTVILRAWPRTDAEVDAMPIDQLCGGLSATVDPWRVSHFSDRRRTREVDDGTGRGVIVPVKTIRVGEPLTADKRAEVLKLRFGDCLSLDKVARQMGMSHRTVSRVIREAGMEGRKPGELK